MIHRCKRIIDSQAFVGILFLSPVLIEWIWWFFLPFLRSIQYSFYDFNYALPNDTKFVGIQNFIDLFADEYFLESIKHSLMLVIFTVPFIIVFALLISVLLNQKVFLRGLFRTMAYLPYVLSGIAVATVFMYLLVGGKLIPTLCSMLFGMENVTWISDTRYALIAIMLMYIWQQIGFYMVMFLSSLQNIPEEMREAARIDGAHAVQEFFYITLPSMKTILSLAVTMGIISSLKIFDQISAISRNTVLGAPAGSTSTIVTYFYVNAFRYGDMGYASAAAIILFLIIFVMTVIQRIIASKSEQE